MTVRISYQTSISDSTLPLLHQDRLGITTQLKVGRQEMILCSSIKINPTQSSHHLVLTFKLSSPQASVETRLSAIRAIPLRRTLVRIVAHLVARPPLTDAVDVFRSPNVYHRIPIAQLLFLILSTFRLSHRDPPVAVCIDKAHLLRRPKLHRHPIYTLSPTPMHMPLPTHHKYSSYSQTLQILVTI